MGSTKIDNTESLKQVRVQCDRENCNYVIPSVLFDDMVEYIGKPCPVCGTVLVTTNDMREMILMRDAILLSDKFINALPDWFLKVMGWTPKKLRYNTHDGIKEIPEDQTFVS